MVSNPATSPCSCDICELMGICDKLLLFSKLLDSWVQVPVQEAIVRLMQCLLAIFKVEASTRSLLAVSFGTDAMHLCQSQRSRRSRRRHCSAELASCSETLTGAAWDRIAIYEKLSESRKAKQRRAELRDCRAPPSVRYDCMKRPHRPELIRETPNLLQKPCSGHAPVQDDKDQHPELT